MRIRMIVVFTALSLLLTAGIASANGDGGKPEGDTLFNFGYDSQAQLFLYGTVPATEESVSECSLANSALPVNYGPSDSDIIPVGTDGAECAISAVSIGANGHINHGQFMKLFNELIDMQGRGCLNRWLAKSELGKNEQHIRHEGFVAADPSIASGEIDFETVTASCDKKDKADDHPGQGHAKAEKQNGKGRPDSPGKSNEAPGQPEKP